MSRNSFQIQSTIDTVIQQLGSIEGAKPVAIVAAYPAHFPLLAGDEFKFRQVLSGILTNVLMKTERDTVRVRAQLMPVDLQEVPEIMSSDVFTIGQGPWALISITDGESAISAIEKVAEEGAIVSFSGFEEYRQQVQQLGGMMWSETVEPGAQTIWLAIPIRGTMPTTADASYVWEAVGTHLPDKVTGGKTIQIFVEDVDLSKRLSEEFSGAGYLVVLCHAAADVLPLARKTPPDLLILDLETRELAAFDLARLLKQDPALARIPILFLTTIADPHGGLRLETAGFLIQSQGTGAMLATVHAALSSGVTPAARVMVVEPQDGLREQMLMRIQAQGHPVVEAASAEEALALAERTRIGVVLANASIAQARDFWLIRSLKIVLPDVKIYVISESLSDEDGQAAILRGAAGFGDTGRLPDLLTELGTGELG